MLNESTHDSRTLQAYPAFEVLHSQVPGVKDGYQQTKQAAVQMLQDLGTRKALLLKTGSLSLAKLIPTPRLSLVFIREATSNPHNSSYPFSTPAPLALTLLLVLLFLLFPLPSSPPVSLPVLDLWGCRLAVVGFSSQPYARLACLAA